MKYILLVCEGLADEPAEELQGRTPLEVAKTPFMDHLAKKGEMGSALFTPHRLPPASDVACMSLLGFDPEEFYTGIAPLEAAAMGVSQKDNEIVFRCDLVTVLDDVLFDTSASGISPTESQILIKELNAKLKNPKVKIYPGEGYKNILVISDPEMAEKLDELECTPPQNLIAQKFVKHLPKGEGAPLITDLMDQSKVILEDHEINRVRIDLNENPANIIWPWGQGKKPKLPSFKQRYGIEGSIITESDYAKGLGMALGLHVATSIENALKEHDFLFIYTESGPDIYRTNDLKAKIKLLEDFDSQVVGNVVKRMEHFDAVRVLVSSDHAVSLAKRGAFHGHVPFILQGTGIPAGEMGPFNEKMAAQSKLVFNEGHKLMEFFLKRVAG